jgi:hypothetical protein
MLPRPVIHQGSTIAYFFKKGEFPKDRNERRHGFWQIDGPSLYVSCIACGGIVNISDHKITPSDGSKLTWLKGINPAAVYGITPECAICPSRKCGSHLFMYLEDYDGGAREGDGDDGSDDYDEGDYEREDDEDDS